ncbi:unnamed protein product [Clonostachys rosea]|uniref:Glycosyl hydrolase family 95 N-terminal domain-containing protein n=1 Tax=Bionectria ochroleuca TaxID=29856 RepID=A0ABY6UTP8_BIOOC|nr:unnamed protein product [Clonostachys rosea]
MLLHMSTWLVAFVFGSLILVTQGRVLWSKTPATHGFKNEEGYILKTAYPLGNGRLGIMPFGHPGSEKLVLNIDSLWSGGPFEASNYTGGNPLENKHDALSRIRSTIFESGTTSDMSDFVGNGNNYGSYRVLGNLTVSIDGIETFTGNQIFKIAVFCSHPDSACFYHVEASGGLPPISISFENQLVPQDLIRPGCDNNSVSIIGVTQTGPPEGLKYEATARVLGSSDAEATCSEAGTLRLVPAAQQTSIEFVIAAGTNYDQTKGNSEHNYTFRGTDPHAIVDKTANAVLAKDYTRILHSHMLDFASLVSKFTLSLPDSLNSSGIETAHLISGYKVDGPGDSFLEALLFDFARYLLISSSRTGSLPANLQGRWTEELKPEWRSDYHANINLQMNYWVADQTGLQAAQGPLFDYMRLNWTPRGRETANLLYNSTGWVTHNEMNIFGHSGMKSDPKWANYPVAPAWMMQHVWDYFDYTQDVTWLTEVGYPLMKGVATFWVSQLQEDAFTNDGTLVAIPCNSPEQGPTTFGCAHYQQAIHALLVNVMGAALITKDTDTLFSDKVRLALAKMDKGLHVASWGGVKEWKMPESLGFDTQNKHRHLSHLTGWYPGYSIASYLRGYTDSGIQAAINKTLIARGNGTASDADAGWAKIWRSACWARLNNTDEAYFHLRYAIDRNFAGNGLSMYKGVQPPFQIDANLGLGGAILSMLVVDLPRAYTNGSSNDVARTVVLGPAIPRSWRGGSVRGLLLRGGGSVDFSWDNEGLVTQATLRSGQAKYQMVNKKGESVGYGVH